MTFQEIFNQHGLYIHKDMKDGVAAQIQPYIDELKFVEYTNPEQIFPSELSIKVYKECFSKDWKKVLNRNQLFGQQKQELLNKK